MVGASPHLSLLSANILVLCFPPFLVPGAGKRSEEQSRLYFCLAEIPAVVERLGQGQG